MDNFISILRDASSPQELEEYKVQLFKENVRIRTDRTELEEMQEQVSNREKKLAEVREDIERQRNALNEEAKQIKKELQRERKRLEEDTLFFEKKQMVLDRAFRQLDDDRRRLEHDKLQFMRYKEEARTQIPKTRQFEYHQGTFFRGVTNQLELKKRYKDLIKIFHPDNVSGDKDTLQLINKEYEQIKNELGISRQTW